MDFNQVTETNLVVYANFSSFHFCRSIQYKHNFMTSLRYKNVFITEKFHEIDERRAELKMEKALPLTANERKSYIELSSLRLVRHEYWMLFDKGVFVLMSTIPVCAILLGDYSLFWFLSVIQFYGNHEVAQLTEAKGKKEADSLRSELPDEQFFFFFDSDELLSVTIAGDGIVAEMCRDLVDIFKPLVSFNDVNFNLCIPHPHHPDYSKYARIGNLIVLCWVMLLLEPFELRFRHIIMDYHYPEVSQERAVWLYHRILTKRSSFLKYARRKFLMSGGDEDSTLTCFEIFRAKVNT